jgi:homoserine kinase
VKVRAPATTANLGPGFDCLGAALDLDLVIETGDGEPFPKRIQRAIDAAAGRPVEIAGTITSDIPVARGLGSSAACVAAGLLIGCTLAEREPDLTELLALGAPIEGHPDNLAPALFGGMTVCTPNGSALRFDPARSVRPVILVPREQLKTSEARKVLPAQIEHRAAVANVARSSGLVALLSGAVEVTAERLLECTEDLLHQSQRARLMLATAEVVADLRRRGIAAAVSGAGPSVVCLVIRGSEDQVTAPDGWQKLEVDWTSDGARIL